MRFYAGRMFPAMYRDAIFIAEHGSWSRSSKAGYRVVVVHVGKDGRSPERSRSSRVSWMARKRWGARPKCTCWFPTTTTA
jgi:glucose/arabinose dehydrogenase